MATRGEIILNRVRNRLPQDVSDNIDSPKIFAIATDLAKDIAEEYLCIESSLSLSIVANTASYDLSTISGSSTGFFRLKLIAPPTTSNVKFIELDVNDFDNIERYSATSVAAYDQYFKIWNQTVKFYPTPTASATYTVYFYKTPTTTISTSTAPETPREFDEAIINGTIEEIIASKIPDLARYYEERKMYHRKEGFSKWNNKRTTPHNVTFRDV